MVFNKLRLPKKPGFIVEEAPKSPDRKRERLRRQASGDGGLGLLDTAEAAVRIRRTSSGQHQTFGGSISIIEPSNNVNYSKKASSPSKAKVNRLMRDNNGSSRSGWSTPSLPSTEWNGESPRQTLKNKVKRKMEKRHVPEVEIKPTVPTKKATKKLKKKQQLSEHHDEEPSTSFFDEQERSTAASFIGSNDDQSFYSGDRSHDSNDQASFGEIRRTRAPNHLLALVDHGDWRDLGGMASLGNNRRGNMTPALRDDEDDVSDFYSSDSDSESSEDVSYVSESPNHWSLDEFDYDDDESVMAERNHAETDDEDDKQIQRKIARMSSGQLRHWDGFRYQVEQLVKVAMPGNIHQVSSLLEQFEGREAELIQTLQQLVQKNPVRSNRAAVHKSKGFQNRGTSRMSHGVAEALAHIAAACTLDENPISVNPEYVVDQPSVADSSTNHEGERYPWKKGGESSYDSEESGSESGSESDSQSGSYDSEDSYSSDDDESRSSDDESDQSYDSQEESERSNEYTDEDDDDRRSEYSGEEKSQYTREHDGQSVEDSFFERNDHHDDEDDDDASYYSSSGSESGDSSKDYDDSEEWSYSGRDQDDWGAKAK